MNRLITIILLLSIATAGFSQEPTHWRGESANGIYTETGLMKSWPADGPEVLWSFAQLGKGHSSGVVDQGFLYTSGMIEETGTIFKFGLDGKLVWKKEYGKEFSESYHGTRGTPVIAGDKIYQFSGEGTLYCLKVSDGSTLWSKSLIEDFDGKVIRWGYNETPVVNGDMIYVTPGGKNNNVLALNRHPVRSGRRTYVL